MCDNKSCKKAFHQKIQREKYNEVLDITMSDYQNQSNIGEQMKEALAEALRTGDFKNLNDLVAQTVTSTLNEVGKHISFENKSEHSDTHSNDPSWNHTGDGQSGTCTWDQKAARAQKEREEQKRLKQQQHWQEQLQRTQAQILQKKEQFIKQKNQFLHPKAPGRRPQEQTLPAPVVKFNKIGSVSNILYKVFGGIGLGATAFSLFGLLVLWGANFPVNGAAFITTLLFMAGFFYMIQVGIGQGRRLKRAQRYMQLCSRKMYIGTEALAQSTGKSKRFILRDLQKMLKLGMFPEGHLDQQKTNFMLNDTIYRQYLEMEENHRRMELEAQKSTRQANLPGEHTAANAEQNKNLSSRPDNPAAYGRVHGENFEKSELNTMMEEGAECIRKLRYLNDQIPGEVISQKLFRLENLLKEIFDNLKEHPDQMHRMHKLMDYYLPTTLKLVEAYEDFDKVSAPGKEITAAKAEIENTLDTINQAFTELLNNLFQDAVLDATTDAQVLKTMLAREGLMNEMDIKRCRTSKDSLDDRKINIDGGQSNEQ